MSIVESLFSALIGGLIVWWFVRREFAARSGAPTAEIERVRVIVTELTSVLEDRAELAEQRLSNVIREAQAVQGLLDRTLTTVGVQMLRPPEIPTAPTSSDETIEPVEPLAEADDFVAIPLPVAAPAVDEPSIAIDPLSDVTRESEPHLGTPGESNQTLDRDARVTQLIESGVTDSVEIARQTGLARGEVELMIILHNLHISPPAKKPQPADAAVEATADVQADASAQSSRPVEAPGEVDASEPETAPEGEIVTEPDVVTHDDRYAEIYALIASGITDSVEIARRTGLGRGEVELHMGLHARNVL